tara:strand:- start:975 stop:1703 length:729 start_codon:yes stop_codon:yes gene_type:complete
MGKYTTKTTDDEGNDAWLSSDGRQFATRSGAWKHSKAIDDTPEPPAESQYEPIQADDEPDPLSWASVDFGGDMEAPTEVVPTVLKRITPTVAGQKKTRKEMEQERKTNVALLKVGYRTGDVLLTRYKRALMEDSQADAISHSETDYDWISGVSNAALEENGISIGAAIGTTQIALIANTYWFAAPVAKIHKEADKSPFTGRVGGAVGRFLERVPVLGKRLKARRETRIEKAEREVFGNDRGE